LSDLFLFQDVQSILFARVPIIKYRQELVGIECDLCLNSSSGLFMSSLLHLLAGLDWRVRPLASFVKEWAKSSQLVKDVRPTNYFTNFTLIMLVVCYLQQVFYLKSETLIFA
jgi:DNA polymerase sigma